MRIRSWRKKMKKSKELRRKENHNYKDTNN